MKWRKWSPFGLHFAVSIRFSQYSFIQGGLHDLELPFDLCQAVILVDHFLCVHGELRYDNLVIVQALSVFSHQTVSMNNSYVGAVIAKARLVIVETRLPANGDFNLHNIILDSVNDIFIDAHLVGKSMKVQLMLFCKSENFLIPPWNTVPCPFMESPQIFPAGHDVKARLIGEERDFNEKFGIIVKAAI